jgi:ryanodine receptor 2
MGTADVKYGDSLVYVQHMKTGLWLSYQIFETKKRGVGRVEEKKVCCIRLFRLAKVTNLEHSH